MEQHQQSPKQRRYLSVVPFGDGDAIFPLYPPPVAMPWDLGRAQANMYQHKVGEAWLLDAEEGIPWISPQQELPSEKMIVIWNIRSKATHFCQCLYFTYIYYHYRYFFSI